MSRTRLLLGCSAWLLLALAPALADETALKYPKARRVEQVDDLHDTEVADPYRWLEADPRESEEVAGWIEAENSVTNKWLSGISQRDAIRKRLTRLWNYQRIGTPFKAGGRYYHYKNDGLQNQSLLYVQDSLEGEARVLIDPNGLSKDGTVALSGTWFSKDGRLVAYGVSSAGSDWKEIRVREIDSGRDLPDVIKWVKFSGASWTRDGRGFFYSRYAAPQDGSRFQNSNYYQKLYYHRLGTPQSRDVLVYERPDQKEWGFGGSVSEDGRWLTIGVWQGSAPRNRLMYKDLEEPYGAPVTLIPGFDARYSFIGNEGRRFLVRTDLDAPRGRVVAVDIDKPEAEHWQTIIPESQDTLRGVNLVNNQLIATYLHDATTRVRIFKLDGSHVSDVKLPGLGSARGFGGRRGDTETFFSFSSFATPSSSYHLDLVSGETKLLHRAKVDFDPDRYVVKQVFFESKDGTKVPLFITHRKGIELDGSHPTLLYGYGGFNIPITPGFSVATASWLEMGGVYASANLRGGGEYGEAWHQAGMLANKQNVFDDFIGAAEHLIESGYTSSKRLAISGRSNGGLLVGACMVQRPDLFGACLPAVGVMDMLRFHRFTIGWAWVGEYGSADVAEQLPALLAYSPYHNLKPGTAYPPTLVTTADTDDRVVPAHSFKFAARLQHCQAGDAPVLIRIETKAGHGAGKPTDKRIAEQADIWAFLVRSLDMKLPEAWR